MKQTFTRDHLLYRRKKLTLKILVHAARIGLLLLLLGLGAFRKPRVDRQLYYV